jgi:hypothetical protein
MQKLNDLSRPGPGTKALHLNFKITNASKADAVRRATAASINRIDFGERLLRRRRIRLPRRFRCRAR